VEGRYASIPIDGVTILRHATAGLAHLHSLDIVHRDVKVLFFFYKTFFSSWQYSDPCYRFLAPKRADFYTKCQRRNSSHDF
jgi:serine/threonine protein kinase